MRRLVIVAAAAAALAVPVLAQTPSTPAQTPAPPAQAPAQPPLGPNGWNIDPAHSAAGFSVRHLMVSTVRGTLGRVSGTIEYDGKSAESIKADVTIDVTAINTGNNGRDNDLKSPNFFDVAKYPTATFKSKRVDAVNAGRFRLIGDLTMHGVTKEVALDVEGPTPAVKQRNGLKVGASATAKVNRRDFGLQYNSVIEAGPVVGDEITLTIDVEAGRPAPAAAPPQR
jgi:polyisoprenoid-binding protein YceI